MLRGLVVRMGRGLMLWALLLTGIVAQAQQVVFSEVLAVNKKAVMDPSGEYDDYIEFYNPSEVEIDLSGYFLSDDKDSLYKWSFPEGTTVDGGDYLIVWADGQTAQSGIHASFKLSSKGETLYLSNPSKIQTSKFKFGRQYKNVSYSYLPATSRVKKYTKPTPGKANGPACKLLLKAKKKKGGVKALWDPMKTTIQVQREGDKILRVEVSNKEGSKIYRTELNPGDEEINLSDVPAGKYELKIGPNTYRLVIQ
ncbi:lamin tail domain-containing protein [bacterium SCSIO 12741]|nr:lamin tail domain-containing protein [bacterium SCSIO 12741]